MIEIVPATSELLEEYYGDMQWPTLQAWFILEDGKPVAIAGFIRLRARTRIIFTESKDDFRLRHKVTVMKFARQMVEFADKQHWELIADPDSDIATAKHFLEHFGFHPGENGEYIRCPV